MDTKRVILSDLWAFRRQIIFVLTPVILLPLAISSDSTNVTKCSYVLILMAVFWTLEVIPMAVTAMMPVILLPTMGILDVQTVGSLYIKDTTILIICGLTIATAIAHWDLHKRIALRMLMLFGAEPRWLMLGIMLPTWFLSMWINNAATCSMMIPIVDAILNELKKTDEEVEGIDNPALELESSTDASRSDLQTISVSDNTIHHRNGRAHTVDDDDHDDEEEYRLSRHSRRPSFGAFVADDVMASGKLPSYSAHPDSMDLGHRRYSLPPSDEPDGSRDHLQRPSHSSREEKDYDLLCKGLTLCVNFATNVGGIGTLIGNGPNVLFQAFADRVFRDYGLESPVSFGTWMVFGFPTSCINLVLAWLWLQIYFLRCRSSKNVSPEQKRKVKAVIQKEYRNLGPMKFAEWAVLAHFTALGILLFFRHPQFIKGWDIIFPESYVRDAVPAVLIVSLLFIFPSEPPRIFCCRKQGDTKKRKIVPLLSWNTVHQGVPWMIIWLHGGGFALAEGARVSGLSSWIGERMSVLSSLEPWLMNMVLTIVSSIITEVTTNTAVITILLPILEKTALVLQVNPLYLMFSASLATSFSFMLPVATLPNAIVYSTGRVRIIDMAASGVVMKVLCLIVLNIAVNTWGDAFFNFSELPEAMRRVAANGTTPFTPAMG